MKDNLMRLLTATLLILCFGATAKIIGQTTDNQYAFAEATTEPHDISISGPGSTVLVTEPPADAIYATVEHMKVLPGKWDDYLEAEKAWKKIHQGRKQRGEIMDWFLFRCTYPGGTDAPYDYITVTHQTAKQLSGPWNWDTMVKGLTPTEIAIADGAENTRNLLDRHLFVFLYGCDQATCKPGNFIQLFFNNVKAGRTRDYEKFLEDGTAMRNEAIKSGKVQAWSIWKRVYPGSPDLDSHTAVYAYETLEALLKNSAPVDFSAELKKVKPTQSYDDFLKQMNELRDFVGSEVWRKVDETE